MKSNTKFAALSKFADYCIVSTVTTAFDVNDDQSQNHKCVWCDRGSFKSRHIGSSWFCHFFFVKFLHERTSFLTFWNRLKTQSKHHPVSRYCGRSITGPGHDHFRPHRPIFVVFLWCIQRRGITKVWRDEVTVHSPLTVYSQESGETLTVWVWKVKCTGTS